MALFKKVCMKGSRLPAFSRQRIKKSTLPEGGTSFPFMPTTNRLHSTFGCRRYRCYPNQGLQVFGIIVFNAP